MLRKRAYIVYHNQNHYKFPLLYLSMEEVIFLGSDHAGFALKEKIKNHLAKKNIPFQDLGPKKLVKTDDYPDYAFKVAKKVRQNKNSKGIFACGSGTGGAIAANRIKGVRAVIAYDEFSAKYSRIDNDANFLSLRSRKFPFRKNKKIISVWLKTPFSKKPRHVRRIRKLDRK
jgi:ribose 5-phosphate isomerase B